MATAAGTYLFYWDINGVLLAKLDVAGGYALPSDQILCVAFSQIMEWDSMNIVVTGGNDGCVRLWSEEMRKNMPENHAHLMSPAVNDEDVDEDNTDQIITIRRLSIHGESKIMSLKTVNLEEV